MFKLIFALGTRFIALTVRFHCVKTYVLLFAIAYVRNGIKIGCHRDSVEVKTEYSRRLYISTLLDGETGEFVMSRLVISRLDG